MPVRGTYCPYDVVALNELLDGTESDVETAFGRMRCLRTGAADAQLGTVFIHGVHDDMATWSPLVQAATQHGVELGPALFVDLPGFGQSENRLLQLDLTEVADAILHVAQAEAGFSSIRVVGHSMGTLVAAEMAVRHPQVLASVHLAAGPYYSIVDAMNARFTGGLAGLFADATFATQYVLALGGQPGVRAVRAASRAGLIRPLLWPFVAHPTRVPQSVVGQLIAGLRPESFRVAARNGFRFRDGMSWSAITCPVWAAYGAADRLVPGIDARRLRADVPHARITTLLGAAHLLHLEQPSAALGALGLA